LRFHTQFLDSIHYVGLLGQERVAQVGCPADILIQPRQHVRERNQCLDAGIPILLLGRVHQRLALQVTVLLQPLLGFDHFNWICGRCQDLGKGRSGQLNPEAGRGSAAVLVVQLVQVAVALVVQWEPEAAPVRIARQPTPLASLQPRPT
jgi:hypothetical protein